MRDLFLGFLMGLIISLWLAPDQVGRWVAKVEQARINQLMGFNNVAK